MGREAEALRRSRSRAGSPASATSGCPTSTPRRSRRRPTSARAASARRGGTTRGCSGYFLANEPPFTQKELQTVELILAGPATATRAALEKWLAAGDTEERRKAFVGDAFDRYVAITSAAVKRHDPNHLNLGMRSGGTPTAAEIRAARAFDVYSVNVYDEQVPGPRVRQIAELTGKPVLIGEFHFGAPGRGMAASLVQVRDQQERGKAYRFYVENAFAMPEMVGTHYFQWVDQPSTGRFDGENYNIGLVDVTDHPYPDPRRGPEADASSCAAPAPWRGRPGRRTCGEAVAIEDESAMNTSHRITLLGAGLIGTFYTMTIHGRRGRDRIQTICAQTVEEAEAFARKWDIPKWTADMKAAIEDPETDLVIIGVPNNLHKRPSSWPPGRANPFSAPSPWAGRQPKPWRSPGREKAGVFAGYLEDLVYTPKTLKSLAAVKAGALGQILWVRSRETHPGPHSAWFWDKETAGGGAIVDMGCHCIEIIRNFVGKGVRPVEVLCTADTLVHPIAAEDSGIGLIRFENKAIGQFEVSWTFRGGMDLRDEVAGTEGTIWMDHFLRTGFEMFSAVGRGGYVAEKAEGDKGWLFPVGDEVHELGYVDMFQDMFDALDAGRAPMETLRDGYVVNAVIDACYKSAASKKWEPVRLGDGVRPRRRTCTGRAADRRSDVDP